MRAIITFMKHKKLTITVVILVVILVFGGTLASSRSRTRTATTYEDAGGWVYSCSKPIPVKDQGIRYENGKPSLTPINQSDVNKYCQRIGIE